MDVDHDKNVWVCDSHNNAIRKIAPDGTVTTIAGNGTAGYVNEAGKNARFNYPFGVTINKNGTAYVLEANNNTIRKIEYKPKPTADTSRLCVIPGSGKTN